jgi:hypothetical protein
MHQHQVIAAGFKNDPLSGPDLQLGDFLHPGHSLFHRNPGNERVKKDSLFKLGRWADQSPGFVAGNYENCIPHSNYTRSHPGGSAGMVLILSC